MSRHGQIASREEVEEFLSTTSLERYQTVPLPHGLEVPGLERRARVDQVLGARVARRSVLDVGTNYGLFPYEAMRRGASRAVGLESAAERAAVARRIAELHGGSYEIREGRVEDLGAGERFDVVLLLNVLHHVVDPIDVMRRLAAVCDDLLIAEFCLPDDPEYLVDVGAPPGPPSRSRRWAARVRSRVLRLAAGGLGLMAVGDRGYHRTFYFSPRAFRNLFCVHLPLFDDIRFEPSVTGQRRVVAFCRVRRES